MRSAYFAPFVILPTVIDAPGQYITRCGEVVTISMSSSRHDFGCLGRYSNGIMEHWHKSGRLYFGIECDNDIVRRAPAAELRDQMWAYTNPINSVAVFSEGFSQGRDCGSLDAPERIARGCTVENITEDLYSGSMLVCAGGRFAIGGTVHRG